MRTMRSPRGARGEDGFTLIELMTVVLIIAILVAIAIPTFLGMKARANDSRARSTLANAHRAVRAVVTERQDDLSTVTTADLAAIEPGLRFLDAATAAEASQNEISVSVGVTGGADYVVLATRVQHGGCLGIREIEGGRPGFQRLSAATCPADGFDPAVGWSPTWPSV